MLTNAIEFNVPTCTMVLIEDARTGKAAQYSLSATMTKTTASLQVALLDSTRHLSLLDDLLRELRQSLTQVFKEVNPIE
jgi:hypothetical protein